MPAVFHSRLLPWIVLLLLLLPIWSNAYFLTGDGPCHLYNAKVWFDMIHRRDFNFFNQYMYLNLNLEPNYFGHFVLGLLMEVFPPILSEKILQSAYVILFFAGFRFVILQINPSRSWLSLLAAPFVYHHVFQMGFYNFSFSLAFAFWMIGFWLQWKNELHDARKLWLAFLTLLCYFAHPVGLVIGLFAIAVLFLRDQLPTIKTDFQAVFARAMALMAAILPVLVLMWAFLFRKPGASITGKEPFAQLLNDLIHLTSLIAVTDFEKHLAQGTAIFVGILLLSAMVLRLPRFSIHKSDIFFLIFISWLLFYFFSPAGFAGAGVLGIRLQIIPYLMLLLWLGSIEWTKAFQWLISTVAILAVGSFLAVRMPVYAKLSNAIEEITSVMPHLENQKTVLNLSYSFNGKTPSGDMIANRIWLFMHAADYVGTEKSILMMPNYEGGTFNFPLIWRWQYEPFSQIGNLEAIPPQANFLDYPQRTGGRIDYVLSWCMDQDWIEHPDTKNVLSQLEQGYELVFTSPNGLAKLYRRKNGF